MRPLLIVCSLFLCWTIALLPNNEQRLIVHAASESTNQTPKQSNAIGEKHTPDQNGVDASTSRLQSLWDKYGGKYWDMLQHSPYLTKSITAGVIGFIGDGLAQYVEKRWLKILEEYDGRRLFSVAAEAVLISGPVMHIAFEVLEDYFPIDTSEGSIRWINTAIQTFLDIFGMNFIYVFNLMVFTALVEGKLGRLRKELRDDYWPSLKYAWASSVIFAPTQLLMFGNLPVELRVMGMNFQDIVWSASVSYRTHLSRHTKQRSE